MHDWLIMWPGLYNHTVSITCSCKLYFRVEKGLDLMISSPYCTLQKAYLLFCCVSMSTFHNCLHEVNAKFCVNYHYGHKAQIHSISSYHLHLKTFIAVKINEAVGKRISFERPQKKRYVVCFMLIKIRVLRQRSRDRKSYVISQTSDLRSLIFVTNVNVFNNIKYRPNILCH